MTSQHLSETDVTHFFVQPKEGEHLPSLLKRCIPQIQTKRARAYNRLEQALRRSLRPGTNSFTRPPTTEALKRPPESNDHDYSTVCANVTVDLKFCSEAVLELLSVLANHKDVDGPLRETDPSEVVMVTAWLDKLQELEEKKLVATVSKHVLSRSKSASESDISIESQEMSAEKMKEKVAKYARELSEVDEMINELLQEIREYFLEHEE